jgi:hypothetical protein
LSREHLVQLTEAWHRQPQLAEIPALYEALPFFADGGAGAPPGMFLTRNRLQNHKTDFARQENPFAV